MAGRALRRDAARHAARSVGTAADVAPSARRVGADVSLAWPALIVREAGLRLGALRDTGALDSWAYLNTPQVESWILHVVLTQLVGLLWLEWLFRAEA